MANEKHVAMMLQRDHEALSRERARDPSFKLDLSGAGFERHNLQDMDLSNADLRNADLRNASLQDAKLIGAKLTAADLSGARAANADLTNADLSDADFTGADLSNANLTDTKVTPQTTLKANLRAAKVSPEILRETKIAGADLQNQDLRGIDLSGCDLQGTGFISAKLTNATFADANLIAARFEHSELVNANFTNANLGQAGLTGADLRTATLVGTDFLGANLTSANLSAANVAHANFYEATLDGAVFEDVIGTRGAHNLRTTKIRIDVHHFDKVVRKWPERFVDWEMIRVAGRLPLFGASYTTLILIPAYLYALEVYNEKVQAARVWIETSVVPARASEAILAHLHEEPIPSKWGLLLFSTFLLAVASTIYVMACPSRVKSFSRDQWCDEHRPSLVHYWADAWTMRWLRLPCAAMYLLGGLGASYVLITKLWCAAAILLGLPSACL
jgi:uncharacterized protein YjbI with pentapeptide repeats